MKNNLCKIMGLLLVQLSLNGYGQNPIQINHQPYIQALTDSSASILWTSTNPAIGWVELAPDDGTHFYNSERKKYFATKDGFKSISELHHVKLTNLRPNTTYRYRVYSTEVLQHKGTNVQYGKTVATEVYRKQPSSFKTSTQKNKSFRFAVLNDIHGNNELLSELVELSVNDTSAFVILNGDMVDAMLSEQQMFEDFLDTSIELFGSNTPFYYSRGNHETRGPFAFSYADYFPTSTGKLYYNFKYGNAYFIVLDAGEDKPDSDIEYSGIVDMDTYRSEQAMWLKTIVESNEYKTASYRIVICHIPPFGGWHGDSEIASKFIPILNQADVDVMLSGHLHKHIIQPADQIVKFPVIVNKNTNIIDVTVDESSASFKIFENNGKLVDELTVNSR